MVRLVFDEFTDMRVETWSYHVIVCVTGKIQIFNSKSNRKLISRIFIAADANTSCPQYRHVNHETPAWQSNVFFHFLRVSPQIYNPFSECSPQTKTYLHFLEDLYFSYVFICVGLRCVRAKCVRMSAGTQGVRKGRLIPWIWSYSQLWATKTWMLGTKFRFICKNHLNRLKECFEPMS